MTASTPVSDGGVTPYIIGGQNPGGSRTCEEVGEAFFGNAIYYQCESEKIDYPFGEAAPDFSDPTGDCAQNAIAVTVTDKTYVAFEAGPDGVGAAIVKGSDDANVYVYEPQVTSDSRLASPLTASGSPAGLSNLTFCWNPVGTPTKCYQDETAWAAGSRCVTRGNWATYTSYSGEEKQVPLFAGQTMGAGTVSFSLPSGEEGSKVVIITIALNAGWRFALNPAGEENGETLYDKNVKVQDYATAPTGNPAPGLFQWWKIVDDGSASTTIEVPLNNFYGVHVDVEKEVPCPTP
jgi:hypothetical protein